MSFVTVKPSSSTDPAASIVFSKWPSASSSFETFSRAASTVFWSFLNVLPTSFRFGSTVTTSISTGSG
eukprot:CAMPEP_0182589138 /NCGR_PEP_ID=MMETSP1324-20130603/68872_2 /TAXON_ID=236786 /ORGANISM="Florenciella sp., Strain RCC1587" /LENGTH=67 /DNA_ID=CAMNT_0024806263 /DNA_START=57 /DNA_END=256 /DNA_ORIENTATION=-